MFISFFSLIFGHFLKPQHLQFERKNHMAITFSLLDFVFLNWIWKGSFLFSENQGFKCTLLYSTNLITHFKMELYKQGAVSMGMFGIFN